MCVLYTCPSHLLVLITPVQPPNPSWACKHTHVVILKSCLHTHIHFELTSTSKSFKHVDAVLSNFKLIFLLWSYLPTCFPRQANKTSDAHTAQMSPTFHSALFTHEHHGNSRMFHGQRYGNVQQVAPCQYVIMSKARMCLRRISGRVFKKTDRSSVSASKRKHSDWFSMRKYIRCKLHACPVYYVLLLSNSAPEKNTSCQQKHSGPKRVRGCRADSLRWQILRGSRKHSLTGFEEVLKHRRKT